jgi:catechol 2,3-dioxygenase-like lactoylglutathione lyase family enzyme
MAVSAFADVTLSIHHIAINAHDPVGMVTLYGNAMGLAPVFSEGGTGWLAGPNGFVAIIGTDDPVGAVERQRRVCDTGITHFCIQMADGNALWSRMDAAGLAFNGPPAALGTGVIYAYGTDAENNVVEVEGVPDADPAAMPWLAHVALASPDLPRLADFYARLIGRAPHNRGRYANALFEAVTGLKDVDVSATWIMADNLTFEMWQYHNPPTLPQAARSASAPGYAHVGFGCADLAAERARIAATGIALTETTVAGFAASAGADPDGNRFVIFEVPAAPHPLAYASLAAPDFVTDRNRDLLRT